MFTEKFRDAVTVRERESVCGCVCVYVCVTFHSQHILCHACTGYTSWYLPYYYRYSISIHHTPLKRELTFVNNSVKSLELFVLVIYEWIPGNL